MLGSMCYFSGKKIRRMSTLIRHGLWHQVIRKTRKEFMSKYATFRTKRSRDPHMKKYANDKIFYVEICNSVVLLLRCWCLAVDRPFERGHIFVHI